MIEFQSPALEDKAWVDELIALGGVKACDYSFTNLFTWNRMYGQTIARFQDFLLVHVDGVTGRYHLWPVGAGPVEEVILTLKADADARGEPFRMACLTGEHVALLERLFPGRFRFEDMRDGYDYLYSIDRLADLGGKKLHAKRNHCNRFEQSNPSWVYEPITQSTLAECLEMDEEWYRRNRRPGDGTQKYELDSEWSALRKAVEHFVPLKLEGGVLRVYGEVVAFTIGDLLTPEVLVVHYEKAYGELQGAYAMINREFARAVRERHPGVRLLNREDDMGIEGLRKAKLSYYPDEMAEKHMAIEGSGESKEVAP